MASYANGQESASYVVVAELPDGSRREVQASSAEEAQALATEVKTWWPEATVWVE